MHCILNGFDLETHFPPLLLASEKQKEFETLRTPDGQCKQLDRITSNPNYGINLDQLAQFPNISPVLGAPLTFTTFDELISALRDMNFVKQQEKKNASQTDNLVFFIVDFQGVFKNSANSRETHGSGHAINIIMNVENGEYAILDSQLIANPDGTPSKKHCIYSNYHVFSNTDRDSIMISDHSMVITRGDPFDIYTERIMNPNFMVGYRSVTVYGMEESFNQVHNNDKVFNNVNELSTKINILNTLLDDTVKRSIDKLKEGCTQEKNLKKQIKQQQLSAMNYKNAEPKTGKTGVLKALPNFVFNHRNGLPEQELSPAYIAKLAKLAKRQQTLATP